MPKAQGLLSSLPEPIQRCHSLPHRPDSEHVGPLCQQGSAPHYRQAPAACKRTWARGATTPGTAGRTHMTPYYDRDIILILSLMHPLSVYLQVEAKRSSPRTGGGKGVREGSLHRPASPFFKLFLPFSIVQTFISYCWGAIISPQEEYIYPTFVDYTSNVIFHVTCNP